MDSNHDLRDHYKRQQEAAAIQMVACVTATIQHMSAEDTYCYMRNMYLKYEALCNESSQA